MRCKFMDYKGNESEGLPVWRNELRPYVGLFAKDCIVPKGEKAPAAILDEALARRLAVHTSDEAFSAPMPSLMRCNVEKRAQLWLTPETADTRDQFLVLYEAAAICGEISIAIDGPASEIFFRQEVRYPNGSFRGEMFLLRLSAGNILKTYTVGKIKLLMGKKTPTLKSAWQVQPNGYLKWLSRSERRALNVS